MNESSKKAFETPYVTANLNYLKPMRDKPTTYACEPPPGVPRINATYELLPSRIHDARSLRATLSLEREGFNLFDHETAVRDFWDEDEVRDVYYREAAALVQRLTGARRTMVFDHTLRRRSVDRAPLSGSRSTFNDVNEPVGRVHTDFTLESAPKRLERVLGPDAAPLLAGRVAILNVWRPLNREPILDAPLAVLDASSIVQGDLVATDLVYEDRVGETYTVTHSEGHRWFYFPLQRRDEAIVFKNYDSDSPAVFSPHSAFDDPTAPLDAPRRESIEIRVFAFF